MDSELMYWLMGVSAVGVGWKAAPVVGCWVRARRKGAPIGWVRLWGMFFENLPLDAVVDAYASAREARAPVGLADLISHARAGGDVCAVVRAYLETVRAGNALEFVHV